VSLLNDIAIIGVGWCGFSPTTPELSFREMMFEAAVAAYEDAGGIDPRKEVDAFVTCEEDFWAGISIADEFMPDQLGGLLKPVYTISGDGLQGIASAYMKIKTGLFDIVVVESHSKASDILTFHEIMSFAFDPIYTSHIDAHPYYLAGLEATYYMFISGADREHLAMVVEKNKRNALANPLACYGAKVSVDDVLDSEPLAFPLTKMDISPLVDVSIVFVLASGEIARKYTDRPIWLEGIGWATDTNYLETRNFAEAIYAKIAADMAYKLAGISNPRKQIDFAEIDDKFSYKELMHVEALKISDIFTAHIDLEHGEFDRQSTFPVNPSGGFLGMGNALEASGLIKLLEATLQLRGEAYGRQIEGVRRGVVQSWRDIPTATGAVAVLSNEEVR
jgi:acetyl-CoA C-acetyltransferase